MLNEIVKLFRDDDFVSQLRSEFINLGNMLVFDDFKHEAVNGFKDFGDHYELSINANGNVGKDNIDVVIDNDKEITVSVYYKDEHTMYKSVTKSTIPSDAMIDTLTADFSNGKILVSVEKFKMGSSKR